MKPLNCLKIALLLGALWLSPGWLSPGALRAQGAAEPPPTPANAAADRWPDEYLVVRQPSPETETETEEFLAQTGTRIDQVAACGSSRLLQVWRLQRPDTKAVLETLAKLPGVVAVEPNWVVRAAQQLPPVQPEEPFALEDTYYATHQWPLQRSEFARAWQLAAGQEVALAPVRVAVIDSGVDFNHPDLSGRLLAGVNYVISGTVPNDDFGHGTHVAGILAAQANNGLGVAGGASNVVIDPLKMLGSSGSGSIPNLIRALCDATDRGADVINLSLEIPLVIDVALAQEIQDAIDYANARGVVVVAAAGNSNGGPVYYPARLNHVLAVAALTIDSQRASYSAVGTQIDLAAGGGSYTQGVLSTWPSAVPGKCVGSGRVLLQEGAHYYCTEPGTSMAAPLVSAAAALLLGARPDLSPAEVEAILEGTARTLALPQTQAGAGLLNAARALRRALASTVSLAPEALAVTLPPGAVPLTRTVRIANSNPLSATVAGEVLLSDWYTVPNVPDSDFVATAAYGQPAYLTVAISPTFLAIGNYMGGIGLAVTDAGGQSTNRWIPIRLDVVGTLDRRLYLPWVARGDEAATSLPFQWEIPALSPTVLITDSRQSVPVALPFPFPFSGQGPPTATVYSTAEVYADGFLAFAESGTPALPGHNQCLPVLAEPAQAIFGWWMDLDPTLTGGQILAFQPASDRFVVEYRNVGVVGFPAAVTLQIVLHANGDIGFNYQEVPAPVAQNLNQLTPQVTVGVQARAGLFYNQVACTTAQEGYGWPPGSATSLLIQRKDAY
ncbi:MAG: S8 family serine peptidase [Chloroflexi bacterium]|nr:S8 family serine peptidase [Chloroflexota bacterium]